MGRKGNLTFEKRAFNIRRGCVLAHAPLPPGTPLDVEYYYLKDGLFSLMVENSLKLHLLWKNAGFLLCHLLCQKLSKVTCCQA